MKQQKRKGRSAQELLGILGITDYGLQTDKGELLFFRVAPTNISVLSPAHIAAKIRHLQQALSIVPGLEIVCTDAAECFDGNKAFLAARRAAEAEPGVQALLEKDIRMMDALQGEMASSRQFFFVYRCQQGLKPEQVFSQSNTAARSLAQEGFELRRLGKEDLKRFLALYFGASLYGEAMPDVDGGQFFTEGESL